MQAGAPALGVTLRTTTDDQVLARGNHVLAAYWEQPEATADALADDWFHTGGGGVLDDEGYPTIVDRRKDVIITGGENVSSIDNHSSCTDIRPSPRWRSSASLMSDSARP